MPREAGNSQAWTDPDHGFERDASFRTRPGAHLGTIPPRQWW